MTYYADIRAPVSRGIELNRAYVKYLCEEHGQVEFPDGENELSDETVEEICQRAEQTISNMLTFSKPIVFYEVILESLQTVG